MNTVAGTEAKKASESVEIVKIGEDIRRRREGDNEKARRIVSEFCDGGYKHRSSEVYTTIDNALRLNSSSFINQTIPAGTHLYRACEAHLEDICKEKGFYIDDLGHIHGFNEENSMEPPLGVSGAGRNNIVGETYLYVSEDQETALSEIKVGVKSIVSLAEIELLQDLKIYNLSNELCTSSDGERNTGAVFTEIVMRFYKRVNAGKDYAPTQAIADYIRKKGFDGLSYKSFYTNRTNYTIFNCHPSYFKFIDSRVVFAQGGPEYFWDESNHQCIVSKYNGVDYESPHSDDLIGLVKERLK